MDVASEEENTYSLVHQYLAMSQVSSVAMADAEEQHLALAISF